MKQEKGSFDATVALVKAKGERLTVQRRFVIEALCSSRGHLTIGAIRQYAQVIYPASLLQESTIYRILQRLKDLRMVSETDMGQDGVVYELLTPPHHHLVCLACGTMTDLDDGYFTALRERLLAECGFEAPLDHLAIYGLCQKCKAEKPGVSPGSRRRLER